MRRSVAAAVVGLAAVVGAAVPAAAETRTVPDRSGDVSFHPNEAPAPHRDRPEMDYVGATVGWSDAGVRVETFTVAPAPVDVVITHMLYLEGPTEGGHHRVLFRSNRPEVDVLTEGSDVTYRNERCLGARWVEEGVRIAVDVPDSCLPLLSSGATRFRLDSFLWERGTIPSDQWHERLPEVGGFSLHRGERPAPATDGPVYDPTSVVGTIDRLYRAALDRAPDPGGLAHWLRARWGGHPISAVAADIASSSELAASLGSATDDAFVRRLYRSVFDREPDQAGYDWWIAQLRRGVPRGAVLVHISESSEHRSRTAALVPPGYRAAP